MKTISKASVAILALASVGEAHAAYSVNTFANTGRGYDRGCAAIYNSGYTGANFLVNDGTNHACIAGGGPGATAFNGQSVTVAGTTDTVGNLTSAHDASSVNAFDGSGSASASASADLAAGEIKLYASSAFAFGDAGAGANANASLFDTLHFTVAGATANTITYIPVSFSVDGSFSAGAPGTAQLGFGFSLGNGYAYTFGDYGAAYYNGTSYPTFSYPGAPRVGGWDSYSFNVFDPTDTQFTGVYAILGASADLPIGFSLNLTTGNNATLDYLHTGKIGIGSVTGLSFTSDSGVFLSAATLPGAVPEPSSWALMLVGFGLVGGSMRRHIPKLVRAMN